MGADGLSVQSREYDAAVARLVGSSKRAAVDVLKQEAKLLFVEVAKVTPPAGGAAGATLQGRQAEQAGKLAIVRDHHEIYGMPGRAYSDLQKVSQSSADAFWACFKQDRLDDAAALVKRDLGKSFVPFDGGRAARSMLGKKKKAKGFRTALFYITNPAALHEHVKKLQEHVWFLASGWREALKALGAAVPYGVGKKSGPGRLSVDISNQRIEIRTDNNVAYADQLPKLRQRIAFAMKVRTGALQRRWDDYMKRLAGGAGFKGR